MKTELRKRENILKSKKYTSTITNATLMVGKIISGDIIIHKNKALIVENVNYSKATKHFTFHCIQLTSEAFDRSFTNRIKFRINERMNVRVINIIQST